MKKIFFGVLIALSLLISSLPAYAAIIQIKVDGVAIASDVLPEIKNNCTMVPLRVISENLGANVHWSNSRVTLTKGDMKVLLSLNSYTADKNGEKVLLDVKPYLKNNRVIVPLRFIAEAFGSDVNYSDFTVTVDTMPLVIDGVQVKALQYEYHMTMGGVVQQVYGNAYNETIYNIFVENKGEKVEVPASYSWRLNLETPGSYYKNGQYDFLDHEGNSVARFDIYTLNPFPSELIEGYPKILIHDLSNDEWYLFNDTAIRSIDQLMYTAIKNSFLTVISDTVV